MGTGMSRMATGIGNVATNGVAKALPSKPITERGRKGSPSRTACCETRFSEASVLFKTPEECRVWLTAAQFGEDLRSSAARVRRGQAYFRCVLDDRARARSHAVSVTLVSILARFESCLFWVDEYGIWPSSEDWYLYNVLRRATGDDRQLGAAPGHLFHGDESRSLVSFLSLAIQFGWGGYVAASPGTRYFCLSHDGWIGLSVPGEDNSVSETLSQWSIEFQVEDRASRG